LRRRIVHRILAAVAAAGLAALAAAPLLALPKRCDTYPDRRVIDPGDGVPAFCGGTGDGCMICYDIIIVH